MILLFLDLGLVVAEKEKVVSWEDHQDRRLQFRLQGGHQEEKEGVDEEEEEDVQKEMKRVWRVLGIVVFGRGWEWEIQRR